MSILSDQMQADMVEAARLTREGRLAEATAVIQRALRSRFAPGASGDAPDGADESIEVTRRAENEISQPTAPSQPDPTRHALRRAPKPLRCSQSAPRPSRRYRGVPHLLGATPGTTEGLPTPAVVPAGGQFVERCYTNRAGTRTCKLYVPSGYVGQEVPLVVMLHGCTQTPDDFAAGTRMNALAEAHTFLVAYPAQAATANSSKCWNWFKAADQ